LTRAKGNFPSNLNKLSCRVGVQARAAGAGRSCSCRAIAGSAAPSSDANASTAASSSPLSAIGDRAMSRLVAIFLCVLVGVVRGCGSWSFLARRLKSLSIKPTHHQKKVSLSRASDASDHGGGTCWLRAWRQRARSGRCHRSARGSRQSWCRAGAPQACASPHACVPRRCGGRPPSACLRPLRRLVIHRRC
jgi:hypothetical protein